jgi:hypothetical protein
VCHTWLKNCVNCAVLTGNSAGLTTVLSSRLSHTELRSSLRKSHSFLSLPADTTMASQGTHSFSSWTSHDIFLFKYHFLLHILRFLFFFSDNIMADVASKQQTTVLFLSTTVTRTRRHTELTKKNWQTWWETCAVPENIQFSFSCSFFLLSETAQFNLECMGPLRNKTAPSLPSSVRSFKASKEWTRKKKINYILILQFIPLHVLRPLHSLVPWWASNPDTWTWSRDYVFHVKPVYPFLSPNPP